MSFLSVFGASLWMGARRVAAGAAVLLLVTGAFNAAATPALSTLSISPGLSAVQDPPKNSPVDFAVVIPAILRLLENDHPGLLSPLNDTALLVSALQRVVLVSTLRAGFCLDLRLHPLQTGESRVAGWQMQLAELSGAGTGARVEAFEGGWRVCTRRAGRYELALQHAFSLRPIAASTGEAAALGWPVALSLSAP